MELGLEQFRMLAQTRAKTITAGPSKKDGIIGIFQVYGDDQILTISCRIRGGSIGSAPMGTAVGYMDLDREDILESPSMCID